MNTEASKPVWMIRENLDDLPTFPLPKPFGIRSYKPGDREAWEQIQRQCEADPQTFPSGAFDRSFGSNEDALPLRLFFLLDESQQPIGTATAWLNENLDGKLYGRIHWVAIVRKYQGRGLAKPLMSIVCSQLRELGHQRACLKTGTHRIPAIRLYTKFGFVPLIRNAAEAADWKSVPLT